MKLWNRSITIFLLDRMDCDVISGSTSYDSYIQEKIEISMRWGNPIVFTI